MVILANLVELTDFRVVHAGGGPSFAPEPVSCCFVVYSVPDHFQRDSSIKALVVGGVHDPHAALSNSANDSIVADLLRHRHVGHGCGTLHRGVFSSTQVRVARRCRTTGSSCSALRVHTPSGT
jgi:hypothetical protein